MILLVLFLNLDLSPDQPNRTVQVAWHEPIGPKNGSRLTSPDSLAIPVPTPAQTGEYCFNWGLALVPGCPSGALATFLLQRPKTRL